MNRIYRVIWSQVKHCYIVVSELTKSCTRDNSSRSYKKNTIALCISLLCSSIGVVGAADTIPLVVVRG